MTIKTILFIDILSILIFVAFIIIAKKSKAGVKPLCILATIPTLSLVAMLILVSIASSHGLKSLAESKGESMWNCPVSALTVKGFTEDTLPENTQGAIIIFVKYGCPDCEGIESTIRDFARNDNVYIVHSTSEVGRALVERYAITDVPSAVYVRINNYNGGLEYTQKSLYTHDANGNIIPNTENINRLLELQAQQK